MSLPSSLSAFTLAQARDALKAKTISSRELTDALLKSVEASRGLNAYVTETPERAVEMAQASDMRIKRGEGGALEGLPLAIKDLFCTKGVRTTAGSRILGNFVPPYESTVTQNLWNAGAVMLGKTNMDEFAMGSSNETSAAGPVFNPWRARNSNLNLVPGGSSGGSAAAVAGDLCLAATGNSPRIACKSRSIARVREGGGTMAPGVHFATRKRGEGSTHATGREFFAACIPGERRRRRAAPRREPRLRALRPPAARR